jgi:SAM-dependent methyltransferase
MLEPGDHHYQAFVGPPDRYDLMGATQMSLLYALGLRSNHRLLDIGCGSLRAGRFFIAYLDPGGYTGLEPNKWLIEEAIEKQIGHDLLNIKSPTFHYNDTFSVPGPTGFDFIVAQSIASHTGPELLRKLLASVRRFLAPDGIAAITFSSFSQQDAEAEGWVYPEVVGYSKKTISGFLSEAGLRGAPVAWHHPSQVWWIVVNKEWKLPSRAFRLQARGVTLSYPRSWQQAQRLGPVKSLARRALAPIRGR